MNVSHSSLDNRHLVLVGLMGTGKSTVGRAVATKLARTLFDTDHLIEHQQRRSVREIFTIDGEAAIRDLETVVLKECLASPELAVIAGAGGVVLRDENRQALADSGARVVWLRASVAVLLDRVQRGGHRPLLDNDPQAALQRMFEEREALYRQVADAIVSVDGRSVHQVMEAILR